MVPPTPKRHLLRVASTLVLALTASTVSAGPALAAAPTTAAGGVTELEPRHPAPASADQGVCPADAAPQARPTITVLLANDHPVFRTGLRAALGTEPDLECVAEVDDGAAATREIARLRPDIAILDLDMPDLADPAVLDSVADLGSRTRLLTLTARDTDENLYRALRLGASAFLTKTLPPPELVAAIRAAVRGHTLLDPHRTGRLIARLTTGIDPFPTAPELAALSAREHEVLLLIADARTNPEIARALGVGEQTVKTHVSNVLAKLGVRDRVHAAVYAHTRRIVPFPSHGADHSSA
ncbi:DNA-binding response regulator [Nocardia panacis]|uniref:DNA-binding response regulator n=1 Tax=Nocardia panacis TaxID=2340916 RepID=A0A3A4KHM1_9NOCA|nr:response regulator transcription factor [Nocardia panacis]RJO74086.1 DNA-binding response regulator [Nocardia panacis]